MSIMGSLSKVSQETFRSLKPWFSLGSQRHDVQHNSTDPLDPKIDIGSPMQREREQLDKSQAQFGTWSKSLRSMASLLHVGELDNACNSTGSINTISVPTTPERQRGRSPRKSLTRSISSGVSHRAFTSSARDASKERVEISERDSSYNHTAPFIDVDIPDPRLNSPRLSMEDNSGSEVSLDMESQANSGRSGVKARRAHLSPGDTDGAPGVSEFCSICAQSIVRHGREDCSGTPQHLRNVILISGFLRIDKAQIGKHCVIA